MGFELIVAKIQDIFCCFEETLLLIQNKMEQKALIGKLRDSWIGTDQNKNEYWKRKLEKNEKTWCEGKSILWELTTLKQWLLLVNDLEC